MPYAFDLIIKNGTVVTASDTMQCDIGIKDGIILQMGRGLIDAARVIDATGKLVMPGGIDSHVHVDEPAYNGVKTADDFYSATVSAACGGNTTLIPFVNQEHGRSLTEVIDEYHVKAAGRSVIDYAFHVIVTQPTQGILQGEIPRLVEKGYTSYKVFMTYSGLALNDRQMLETFQVARQSGALMMVHAENDHCIHWLTEQMSARGETALAHFPQRAPSAVEREATHRAITLGEIVDTPVLIVHVSSSEALEQLEWARRKGLKIHAETCPQYLLLHDDLLTGCCTHDWEGAKYTCSPPLRQRTDSEALWKGIRDGLFEVVSSDHCPYLFEGTEGKRAGGEPPDMRKVPSGLPGVEARLPLLFSEGVRKGRFDIHTFVAVTSTNAAKLYGLYPRKGNLGIGADADIAIWDLEKEVTLSSAGLHDNADYTPYENMNVKGWPVYTICRGVLVSIDGEPAGDPLHGQFLACDKLPAPLLNVH